MKAAVGKLLDDGKALLAGQDAASLAADRVAAIKQVDATWRATNAELARLLQVRIDRLQRQSADEAGDRRRGAGGRASPCNSRSRAASPARSAA